MARQQQVQTTNQITGRRRWWALAAVLISMFFSSLDQTVVSTAMPTIISELNGFSIYAWTFTAYILTSAVSVPLYGRLSDIYGRKPFYLFGLIVFMIGSAWCGLAHSMETLVYARALQGIGGGAMMSMPRASIGDIFDPRERGKWMGLIMGVFGLASLIGPALGGWITDSISWRWVFYINLPVAFVALVMVYYALPKVRVASKHAIDWFGAVLLSAMLVALLLGFTWGGSTYAWTSWQELGIFALSAVLMLAFILYELRVPEPVVALEMFKNGIFNSTMVISLMIMMAMFSAMLFLPIFVQGVLGFSATNSGYIMTPMMLSFIVGSVIAGALLTRTGKYKVQSLVGAVLLMIGTWLLTRLGVGSSWAFVVAAMLVMGIGIGSLMPAMATVVQNIFPYRMMGTVNATQQTVSSLAGAIAAPIFNSVLTNRFTSRFNDVLPDTLKQFFSQLPPDQRAGAFNPQALVSSEAQQALKQQFQGFGPQGQELYNGFIGAVHDALTYAMRELYVVALIFACLAFFATFFLREVPLKGKEFYTEGAETPAGGADSPAPANPQ
ncbi:MAG TPA: MDR family MFS transporter [Limnochordia bacterium]|nr:MDR family MFS transporter [Limnochordia bacterium]